MKVKKAIEKWCPHSRLAGYNSAFNRSREGKPSSGSKCITHTCMAWVVAESWKEGYCSLMGEPIIVNKHVKEN